MSLGAMLIAAISIMFIAGACIVGYSFKDSNDITQQIIREHEEEIKRLRAKYE